MNKTTVAQQAKSSSFLPPAQGILQRTCACGNHTVAGGECVECAKNKSGLQRKLAIAASNDPLEREADRVAEQVLAASANPAVSGATPSIQRYAGQPLEQSEEEVPASVDRVLGSSGRPLDIPLRKDMESRFGHDFSQVRVHVG
ncbi:MAG: eCIS core domain-containing protein, partial [Methylococcales bacterium]